MIKLACIVYDDWETGLSGVHTFMRTVHDAWENDFECDFITYPIQGCSVSGLQSYRAEEECEPSSKDRGQETVSSLRLFLGYLGILWRDIRFAWRIRKRCEDRLVVVNEFGCETLPIALRLVMPSAKIIAIAHTHPGQNHNAGHWVRRMVERACLHSVSGLVFNSASVQDEWCKKLNNDSLGGEVIHYGISAPDLSLPVDYPHKEPGVVDFVCVSRFAKWKGHKNLLQAWSKFDYGLRTTDYDCRARLILVGDGETFEDCKELANGLGVENSVIFLGSRENGARYFNGADVAVQLSTEPEAFGLVLLEAMSRAKPVLASEIGGIREVVMDGPAGILVDPNDSDAVVESISRLAYDEPYSKILGVTGFNIWMNKFSVNRMLADYKEYFKQYMRPRVA